MCRGKVGMVQCLLNNQTTAKRARNVSYGVSEEAFMKFMGRNWGGK